MKNVCLRYYFKKELIERYRYSSNHWDRKYWKLHQEIRDLLSKIKEKLGISFELFEFSEKQVDKIYKEHFISRARTLKRTIRESVARALRSRRGRGYIYLHNTIALVKNDQVIWFNYGLGRYHEEYEVWKRYDKENPSTIGFLKACLHEPGYLRKIVEYAEAMEKSCSKHELLVKKFIEKTKGEGKIIREVEVGKGYTVRDAYGNVKTFGKYRIDIVWKKKNETYVIEVKEELTPEALGQTIIYKELYQKEHPKENVKTGIVCEKAADEIINIAKRYIDNIWVVK